MFRQIFMTAILAGFAAGLLLTALQAVTTVPLILEAESYESGGQEAATGTAAHAHEAAEWAPEDGLERTLYTGLTNVLTAVGFALLLAAAFALRGAPVDGRRGVLWGLAGFATFSLAPGLGLPPEVPGSMAADLVTRQAWWLATVLATGFGLWLLLLGRQHWQRGLGVVALALPHLIGAPHPETIGGPVPPELAGHFAAAVLATAAVFWAVLGWLAGSLYAHFEPETAGAPDLVQRPT